MVLCLIPALTWAQKTNVYLNPQLTLNDARELFKAEKYVAAQKKYKECIDLYKPYSEERVESEFYLAYCAYELFNEDAENLLLQFVQVHPESNKSNLAFFLIGNNFYRSKNFKQAIKYYEATDEKQLEKSLQHELKFKLGYCYFVKNDFEKAKPLFYAVKDIDNQYAPPATYYYSHIAYIEKKYETALEGFKKFGKSSTFGPVVPYYIAQIYFFQKKYELVIDYGQKILDSASAKKTSEISRLIGDSYVKLYKYEEALPYLEKYVNDKGRMHRDDFYEYAYVYYQTKKYEKAIEYFQKSITEEQDSITQLSYYNLADCLLKSGKKEFARNAFLNASKINIDEKIKEDALFNYAKLAYELESDPFHNSITAFRNFLKTYPQSDKYDEAFNFLVNAFLRSRNYTEALNVLEEMENKTIQLKTAYQRLSYLKASEYFNNANYSMAIEFYNKAMKFTPDRITLGKTIFWKAESYYRLNEINEAIVIFNEFLATGGSGYQEFYNHANYNVGYCYFNQKNYEESGKYFRKYIQLAQPAEGKKITDAHIRVADGFFVNRDFLAALEFYSKAEEAGNYLIDYVTYQKAVVLGLLGKNDEKILHLKNLVSQYPKSTYIDKSLYELADSYLMKNDNDQALVYFKSLLSNHENSLLIKKAQMKLALIYSNTDQDDKAIESFQEIIKKYPNTNESQQALNSLRDIYVQSGKIADFEKFVSATPNLKYSSAALDSAAFESAELMYIKEDCKNAVIALANYIQKYPMAIFSTQANYYKADCEYKLGNLDEALKNYEFVASLSLNNYTEKSVARAAYIHNKKKQYQESKKYFIQLEQVSQSSAMQFDASWGIMKNSFRTEDYEMAIEYANKLISDEKSSNDQLNEARFIKGKSYLITGRDSLGLKELRETVKTTKSERGAEAKYLIAEYYYKNKVYDVSIKHIKELLDQDPSYDYWVTNSYILYGEIFYAQDDVFNARETLQSVIDNSENAELVKKAKDKLQGISDAEKLKEERFIQDSMEIKFENNTKQDDELFKTIENE